MKKRKSKNYKRKYEVSLEELHKNENYKRYADNQSYEQYLKRDFIPVSTNHTSIDYKNLEDICYTRIAYESLRSLPLIEKFAIYVCVFQYQYLDRLCKDAGISKNGFLYIYESGVRRFKSNWESMKHKKYLYNPRSFYTSKGGDSNA